MLESLTLTESRIAELVAAGWTNDEIAAALCMSPKTIEWNLTKLYRRFGLRSRTGLAALILRTRGGSDAGGSPEPPG